MYDINELRKIYFFEKLDEKELKLLSTFSTKKTFSKGEIVFYEKDTPKSLILLVEGVLKVYKTDLKNNEIVMHRFKPTTLIAEMVVFEGVTYPASASFDTDGTIIEIDFAKFKKEFFSNPEVALNFFRSLSRKIKHLEDVIALNIVLDSTARIAKFICENEEALGMKHSQLAQYLHMTPETLSRMFKKLVTLGLVEKSSKGYVIKNREGLQVLFE
jgi:CRP/FNR family transcriptional regulator